MLATVERIQVEWSQFKSSRVVELSRVESTVDSSQFESWSGVGSGMVWSSRVDSGRVESGLGVELSGVESTVNSSRGVESSRWSTADSSRFELSHGVECVESGGVGWCGVLSERVGSS